MVQNEPIFTRRYAKKYAKPRPPGEVIANLSIHKFLNDMPAHCIVSPMCIH